MTGSIPNKFQKVNNIFTTFYNLWRDNELGLDKTRLGSGWRKVKNESLLFQSPKRQRRALCVAPSKISTQRRGGAEERGEERRNALIHECPRINANGKRIHQPAAQARVTDTDFHLG